MNDEEIIEKLEKLKFDQWSLILDNGKMDFINMGSIKGITFEIRTKEKGHNKPHCHIKYQGKEASFSIEPNYELLAGDSNKKMQSLAHTWIEMNIIPLVDKWNEIHDIKVII